MLSGPFSYDASGYSSCVRGHASCESLSPVSSGHCTLSLTTVDFGEMGQWVSRTVNNLDGVTACEHCGSCSSILLPLFRTHTLRTATDIRCTLRDELPSSMNVDVHVVPFMAMGPCNECLAHLAHADIDNLVRMNSCSSPLEGSHLNPMVFLHTILAI